jgi:hypothetical protein
MDHERVTWENVDEINVAVDSVQDICTQRRWAFVTFAKIGLG